MAQEDEHFESSLRDFAPAELPQPLQSRILEIFDTTAQTTLNPAAAAENISNFPLLRSLAVAAAILIAATGVFFSVLNNLDTQPGTKPDSMVMSPEKAPFLPVHAENVFEGVDDEGIFLTGSKVPVHGVRYRFSDSFRWKNPKDGAVIEMTVPSERLYLIPVRTD